MLKITVTRLNQSVNLLQKPGVWELRNERGQVMQSLEEMGGYVSQVVRVLTAHLNLSTIVTTTNSFGVELANGSWSGMIGFLRRRVGPEFCPSGNEVS